MSEELSHWKTAIERRISVLEKAVSRAPQKPTLSKADKLDAIVQQQKDETPGKFLEGFSHLRRWKSLFGIIGAILGLITGVLSFFPHLTVSEPTQMDPTDFFSYQLTISNEGILPIFRVRWALAPRVISVSSSTGSGEGVTLLLPHYADWIATDDLMNSLLPDKPGSQRHAALLMRPGGKIVVDGPADYEFHLRSANNRIGTLSPGDQFTFTTEGLISAPAGTTYDTADFAVSISYVPVFPPIPMQTCSHFHVYKDRQGTAHWFKSPNQCDRFPWLHNWFPSQKIAK